MRLGSFSAHFAKVLRSAREAEGLSQEGLALKAKLTRQYVGMIERGERKPTVEAAHALATVLRVPLSVLIKEAEKGASR